MSKGKEIYYMIGEKQKPWANQNSREINGDELHTTLSVLRKSRYSWTPNVENILPVEE